MLGNIINTLAIIGGCLLGLVIKKGIHDRYQTIVMQGIGMSVLFIGISSALSNLMKPDSNPVLFILSLVIGGLIGEWLKIEQRLEKLGDLLQSKLGAKDSNISQGFVTASLVFCVGSMAIIGSLESGLRGNHSILFAKATLDGIASVIFTTTLGIGVIFSAIPVFLYQGSIVVLSHVLEPYLTQEIIREMSIIGGILICGIGLSVLEIKKIKTANLLPAIGIPIIYYLVIIPIANYITKLT